MKFVILMCSLWISSVAGNNQAAGLISVGTSQAFWGQLYRGDVPVALTQKGP